MPTPQTPVATLFICIAAAVHTAVAVGSTAAESPSPGSASESVVVLPVLLLPLLLPLLLLVLLDCPSAVVRPGDI